MNCRIGLISWPVANKSPATLFLCFGEMYNKEYKNVPFLSKFNQELSYLTPFVFYKETNTCSNIEEIDFFRDRLKLTRQLKIYGNNIPNKCILRTPILYDLDCGVPIFKSKNNRSKFEYIPGKKICIVLPYKDPITRGILLEHILEKNQTMFILTGNVYKRNKDTIATLMSRYLLLCGVSNNYIIKSKEGKKPECIMEALNLLKFLNMYDYYEISVACISDDINFVSKSIKNWRKQGKIDNKKINFLCPFWK